MREPIGHAFQISVVFRQSIQHGGEAARQIADFIAVTGRAETLRYPSLRVDGVLCVDLPPGEDADYKKALDDAGVATVFLAAPTSTPERIAIIAKNSTGFVYYVSRTGVTGERADIATTVQGMVASIKQHTSTPVAVGFGISSPAQAAEIAGYSDGVIVGSALKVDGDWRNPVDPARVEALARALGRLG